MSLKDFQAMRSLSDEEIEDALLRAEDKIRKRTDQVAPDATPDVKSGMYDILWQASIDRITFQDDDIRKITDGAWSTSRSRRNNWKGCLSRPHCLAAGKDLRRFRKHPCAQYSERRNHARPGLLSVPPAAWRHPTGCPQAEGDGAVSVIDRQRGG